MRIEIKYILTFLVFMTFSLGVFAQDKTVDSLKAAFKNAKQDTTRIRLRNEIGEIDMIFRISFWDSLAQDSKHLAEKYRISSNYLNFFYLKYLSDALNNIGFIYSNQGEISKALEYYHNSLKIEEEIRNKSGIATSLNNIGMIYNNQGDIPKSLNYYFKSLHINEEIKNKKGIALSLNNIGYVYDNQGDIIMALDYYHKSLKILEETKDKEGIANSLNNIGSIYHVQGDIPKALEFYHKSLGIREEIKDLSGIANTLTKIGGISHEQGDPHKALKYYLNSLKIQEEMIDKEGIANSLNNIGYVYDNLGDIPRSLDYYKKSLIIQEEIKDKSGIANTLNNLSGAMLKQGRVIEALKYGIRSMKTAQELGYPKNIKRAAFNLKNIYKKQSKFKEALEMYELEIQMRDSINNKETKKASIKKQFQYQYEKKAAADSVKNAEEQKVKNAQLTAQQAQLKQEKTQRFALYGGLFLVVTFSGFVFNRFKITQRQKAIIVTQKGQVDLAYEQLHEKNKEITDSIIYARRIQNCLLTPLKYIDNQLNRLTKGGDG